MQTAIEAMAHPEDLDELLAELADSYDEEMARIDEETDLVNRKLHELQAAVAEASQVPIESIVRVKEREYDDLMAEGKPEEAAQKLKEAGEMKAVWPQLEDSWSDCTRKKAELESERRDAARKVLDEWKPKAVELIRPDACKLYATLDRIAAAIKEFIDLTGNTPVLGKVDGIDSAPYINSLLASDGEEGEARKKWFTVTETHYIRR